MASSATCPFCNAIVPFVEPLPQRLLCPRCSEFFVPNKDVPAQAAPTLDQEVQRHRDARPATSTNWLRFSLGAIVVLAALGVGIWFWQSQHTTTSHPPAEAAKVYIPEEMPALSYLPPGTDSVVAVQLLPILGNGQTANSAEIRGALVSKGIPAELLDAVQKQVGVNWDQIDHFVIGCRLKKGPELDKLVAILHLRSPVEEDTFAEKMQAALQKDRTSQRDVYQTRGIPSWSWWIAGPQMIVGALSLETMRRVPASPLAGLDHLDPSLVSSIRDKIPRDSYAWAVLQSDQFSTIAALLNPRRKIAVNDLRGIAIAITPSTASPRLAAQLWFKSSESAQNWKSELQARFAGHETVQIETDSELLKLNMPVDPAIIRDLFGKK